MTDRTINKIISKSPNLQESLLDLTSDSVSPENLRLNETAHNNEGEGIVGMMPEGGTSDYDALNNRPQINSNLLTGNKTGGQLGLQNKNLDSPIVIGGQTITEVEPALHALNNKSGGGGHTILDEDGNTYPQRNKLQFEGCEITDDSTNDITKIRLMANNAGAHNAIYRGKALGSSVTPAQYAEIDAGTFEDLYIGDYWRIGGVNYRIAAFDYWLRCGNTKCTKHHVVIVPDSNLYSANMNDSNITTGGYVGSKMYTDNLASAKTTIKNAFGAANILSHKEYLVNAVANGKPSAGTWYDSDIELMNERMVYGCPVFEPACDGSTVPILYTIDKSQLPLFAMDPSRITNRVDWWLRDVVSGTNFALVNSYGNAGSLGASGSYGVRPAFAIYKP